LLHFLLSFIAEIIFAPSSSSLLVLARRKQREADKRIKRPKKKKSGEWIDLTLQRAIYGAAPLASNPWRWYANNNNLYLEIPDFHCPPRAGVLYIYPHLKSHAFLPPFLPHHQQIRFAQGFTGIQS
jgi:hypothetical protein